MVLVTSAIAIAVFAIIIIVSAMLAWWIGPHTEYEKGYFNTFIAILAGLGVFITFLFYYNVVELQNQQQQLASVQEMSRIDSSILNGVLQEINKASTLIPNFVLSITPLSKQKCCNDNILQTEEDPVNPQTCIQKLVLSYIIFSSWQDVVMSQKCIQSHPISYVSNFLQRANSKQLFDQWTISKLDFFPETQYFGDLLFEYGLNITDQTVEEYEAIAHRVVSDSRYKQIFE